MIRPTILDAPASRLLGDRAAMKDTLLLPGPGRGQGAPAEVRGSSSSGGTYTGGLPPELLQQSVGRLRVLALLYAFIFFMAAFFPRLLFADTRAYLFSAP